MRRLLPITPLIAGIFLASPAQACGTHPVPQAIVFATPPDERPQGSLVVQVELVRHIPDSYFSVVKVTKGPRTMVGRKYRMSPNVLSSCTTFGRDKGFAVVDGKVHYSRGVGYLSAITYNRSLPDHFLGSFVTEPYRWAGDPTEAPMLEGPE